MIFSDFFPAVHMTSLHTDLANLQDEVGDILATPVIVPRDAPSALGDDTVLEALVSDEDAGTPSDSKRAKC